MRPLFAVVRMHFPDPDTVPPEELYQWIGYPENVQNFNFANTCAIRMSLALLGAGMPNPGAYPVKAGKHRGRAIETQQHRLSHWLLRYLGQPEKYASGAAAEKAIGSRHGIVSFFHLHDALDPSGHIAIVSIDRWSTLRCGREREGDATGCYWSAREVWFWPLP